jgi:hypothetical protein
VDEGDWGDGVWELRGSNSHNSATPQLRNELQPKFQLPALKLRPTSTGVGRTSM